MEIVEPHMYDVDDAVAKIDGYIISIAGAAAHVGEKRMVRIDQVGRTAASALLLDESGEVVVVPERSPEAPAAGRSRGKRRSASARRPTGSGEPSPAADSAPQEETPATPESADGAVRDEGEGDDLQSKPRRRGRRGGRRRSAAKARATTE